jgi:hypothetical protein
MSPTSESMRRTKPSWPGCVASTARRLRSGPTRPDGVSDAGEGFGLADLGIASLDAVGAPLGVTTPSGNLPRE